jgi:tetratricopeptide (TPR) repeat protein
MAKVFISYKHDSADTQVANRLADRLAEAGHDVFIDRKIPAGMEYDQFIEKQIRSCGAFVILVSRAAQTSDWIFGELRLANDLRKARGCPQILPVVLEELGTEARMGWRVILDMVQHMACLDLEQDWEGLIFAILRQLGDSPKQESEQTGTEEEATADSVKEPEFLPEPMLKSLDGFLENAQKEIRKGDFATARDFLIPCLELIRLPQGVAPLRYQVRLFNDLALVFASLRDTVKAIEFARQARDLLTEYEDAIMSAHNEHRFGFIYLQDRSVFDALKHLESAYVLAKEHNALELWGQVEDTTGRAWQELGLLDVAIEHFKTSLALKERCGDRRGQAISHGNLGRAYQKQGELSLAEQHFKRDLELSHELGDDRGRMLMESHLAELLRQQYRHEESLEAYAAYLLAAEWHQWSDHLAFAHLGLAKVKTDLALFEEAQQHLVKANQFDAPWFRPLVLQASAELAARNGQPEEAIFLFEQTVDAFGSSKGQPQDLVETLSRAAQVYGRIGDDDKAIEWIDRAISLAEHTRLRWLIGNLRFVKARISQHGEGVYLTGSMPLPIAVHAHRVDAAVEPLEHLDARIELFKSALRYVTTICLAQYLSLEEGSRDPDADRIVLRSFEHRNPSLGLWAEVLRVVVQVLAKQREQLHCGEVVDVFVRKSRDRYRLHQKTQQRIQRLLEVRNRISHIRRPNSSDAQEMIVEIDEALEPFLADLRPLWSARLFAFEKKGKDGCLRELVGPSAFVHWPPCREVKVEDAEDGEVFLVSGNSDHLLSLYPWWLARWRAESSSRGDLFRFSKRSHSRSIYLHVETGEEQRLVNDAIPWKIAELRGDDVPR